MSKKNSDKIQIELHETAGAISILDILREEMEQWLEEAQDESKHEALENVLGHIGALEIEYQSRHKKLQERLED
jgi:hypothetical protein